MVEKSELTPISLGSLLHHPERRRRGRTGLPQERCKWVECQAMWGLGLLWSQAAAEGIVPQQVGAGKERVRGAAAGAVERQGVLAGAGSAANMGKLCQHKHAEQQRGRLDHLHCSTCIHSWQRRLRRQHQPG